MNTTMTITLRRFPVTIRDERTGEVSQDKITLEKSVLDASRLVGQSSKELIYRYYNKAGFRVLDIGKAEKKDVVISLGHLFPMAAGEAMALGVSE